jgi:hypothetical protein
MQIVSVFSSDDFKRGAQSKKPRLVITVNPKNFFFSRELAEQVGIKADTTCHAVLLKRDEKEKELYAFAFNQSVLATPFVITSKGNGSLGFSNALLAQRVIHHYNLEMAFEKGTIKKEAFELDIQKHPEDAHCTIVILLPPKSFEKK